MTLNVPPNEKQDADETPKYPEIAPEGKIGVTEREKEWAAQKPPRPHVPRYVFIGALACLALAFAVGATWYYRKNILPEKYYMKASAQFDAGNYGEAFTLYEKVSKIQPARRDVYNNMARALAETGEAGRAAEYYETHLRKQPDDARAKWEAGELYAETKNYARALELMTAARVADGARLERIAEVLLLDGKTEEAADYLRDAALASGEAEKTIEIAKRLMDMGFYRQALEAFSKAARLDGDDKRGIHGANAAKAMLGLPTDPALTVIPGESMGLVRLGSSQDEVSTVMGAPEKQVFTQINRANVEIWHYGDKNNKMKSMTVFFVGGKVREIETRYREFKTEEGLGPGNFMLEKQSGRIEKRAELDDGRIRFDVKGGGMTFYAAGVNEAGDGARYAKLIVHRKGEKPLGESSFTWLKLPW